MYVFDATAALARIEQGLLVGALAATYSTGVGLLSVCVPRVGRCGDAKLHGQHRQRGGSSTDQRRWPWCEGWGGNGELM